MCGTSWRPIPKTTAQPMNRNANRNFAFGLVILRTQLAPPSAVIADRRMIPIIRITIAAEIPNGIGCWKATRKSCTPRMLADGCRRREWPARRYDGRTVMTPFDRLGRFVVRRAWWVVAAWARAPARRAPARAAGPGPAERRRLHPRRPRVGPGQGPARDRARRPAVGAGHRLQQPDRSRPARRRSSSPRRTADPRTSPTAPHVARVVSHLLAPRQVSADRHTAYDIVFLDLPPDDSPEALPILRERLREAPGPDVELAGGPAFYGDVQTVSEADLQRSEVISLPLAALALLLVFGSVVAAGVPLVVGGAAVVVALAGIFLVASVTPMSIFVLNLATLLGLGLGRRLLAAHDEPLPRGAGAPARTARTASPRRSGSTVATAGRAVFFSGLTVLLGLLGLVLFEFMILRSVGIAGAIVVGLAVAVGADAAARRSWRSSGTRIDRLAIRRVAAATGLGRAVVAPRPAGSCAARSPSSSRRSACPAVLGSPFLHVRFNAPDASILPPAVPSRAAFDRLARRVRRGRVRAASSSRSGPPGRRPSPANLAAPVRLLAPAGRRPADQPGRQPRRRRPAADARPVPAALRRPGRPAATGTSQTALAATTRGDLTAFTLYTPYGPNRDEGKALVARPARPGRAARAAGRRDACSSAAAPRTSPTSSTASRADFPRTALFIVVTTYLVLFVLLRSVDPAGQGAGHEHAVDRRELRGAGLDLPGRQPLGAPRASSRSGSSRRPSR